MPWELAIEQLSTILRSPVEIVRFSTSQWEKNSSSFNYNGSSYYDENHTYVLLNKTHEHVTVMCISSPTLSDTERQLVEMNIKLMKKQLMEADELEQGNSLHDLQRWLNIQLDHGRIDLGVPDHFSVFPQLHKQQIPILMISEVPESNQICYEDSKRLLESFFEEEILLIPLKKREWLMMGPEHIISASSQDENEAENLEDALESVCLGLHEMVATEWIGECHFSIHPPIVPASDMLKSIVTMREAVQLGKSFRMSSNVHLPWKLRLEKMLNYIPLDDKISFLEQILGQTDHVFDVEMLTTLEYFFDLGCNVSETAKKLYIHRNTLLYRLDKFKQETGLDVRTFNDAVLVKIAMLLYKVTKRI